MARASFSRSKQRQPSGRIGPIGRRLRSFENEKFAQVMKRLLFNAVAKACMLQLFNFALLFRHLSFCGK